MLQGVLAKAAAKAREVKGAVGTAVGEIRDALENPEYEDGEDGAREDTSGTMGLLSGEWA